VLTATLAALTDADLVRIVTIRGEPHTVARALARSLGHLAYHQGQVTLIARTLVGPERWKVITIPRGGSREHDAAAGYAFHRPPRNVTSTTGVSGMSEALARFAAAYSAGSIRTIDLTQVLSPDFPTLVLPPHLGQAWPFRLERISRYDEAGPGWYWNNFSCSEHVGTHFDAPAHWITGRNLPRNTVDTIDVRTFIAPVAVVDASVPVAGDEDWLLTVDYLREWEGRYGRIPAGGWLAFRTDWSKRLVDPASFVNMREDGAHSPGPTQETVEWLIHERNVLGFAVETINTDAGQSYRWPLPYPCHTLMHGAGRFGLQCLRNLDQLPPTGALIVAAPLKILEGSGSPLRVIALV
jgi:kynurenine formamidase